MVAKARTPSATCVSKCGILKGYKGPTNCSNNLRLKTKLVAKAPGKIVDSALAIARYVGRLPDVVEHVPASEEQDGDETDGSPEIAVLQDGKYVRRGDGEESDGAKNSGGDGDELDVVDGAGDGGFGDVGWELARYPCVEVLCCLRAVRVLVDMSVTRGLSCLPSSEVEADGLRVGLCVGANGGVEVQKDRSCLELELLKRVSPYVVIGCISKVQSYRLEGVLPVHEVECPEKQPALPILIALGPALAQQLPFRLKLVAHYTAESRLKGREQHGHRVVSRRLGQLRVGCIVEAGWLAGGAEVIEAVAGGLLGRKGGKGKQRGREGVEPPHCVGGKRCGGRGELWWELALMMLRVLALADPRRSGVRNALTTVQGSRRAVAVSDEHEQQHMHAAVRHCWRRWAGVWVGASALDCTAGFAT